MKSVGLNVFGQLIKLLPMPVLTAIAAEHAPAASARNARKFTERDYFTAMLFGQLSGATSLRELELGLEFAGPGYIHSGAKIMRRTTLAYNNNHATPEIYQRFFFQFLKLVRPELLEQAKRKDDRELYSLDSTTITLGFKLFWWANFKRNKKGIKLHTVLCNSTSVPEVVIPTVAKRADVKCAKAAIEQLPENAIVVMDRGYNDYELFRWMDNRGTTFVTRLKKNARHTPMRERVISQSKNCGEYGITFTSPRAVEVCGDKEWRVVQWYDEIEERWFEFITNDFELPPSDIAELYRQRWKVELFFKKLKQNFIVTKFYGSTEPAVISQIWIALTATLLLDLLRHRSDKDWQFSQLVWGIRQNLLRYRDINEIINLKAPAILGKNDKSKIPIQGVLEF